MVQFGDIVPFLSNNTDVGPALRSKLMNLLNHPLHCAQLKMELAVVVDFGDLEGDGTLVVTCYEEIVKLRAVIQAAHHPNVVAIACSLAQGNIATVDIIRSYLCET